MQLLFSGLQYPGEEDSVNKTCLPASKAGSSLVLMQEAPDGLGPVTTTLASATVEVYPRHSWHMQEEPRCPGSSYYG